VVYHLAACISISRADKAIVHKTNVEGVRNVMKACLECGVKRVVHFSSIHAYSSQPVDQPIDETRPHATGDNIPQYDRSKALGEKEVYKAMDKGLDVVIVNPTGIIGPFDFRPSPMGQVLLNLWHHQMPGLVVGGFNWVDVRDVVAGAMAAEEKGRTGEKYLLSGHWQTMKETAQAAENVSGVKAPGFVSPMWLARFGAPFSEAFAILTKSRPLFTKDSLRAIRNHRLISHEKATKELGYNPRPFQETINDTYNWFKANNRINGQAR